MKKIIFYLLFTVVFVQTIFGEGIWAKNKKGENLLFINKLDYPDRNSSLNFLEVSRSRFVDSLDGKYKYFIDRASETQGALIEYKVDTKEARYLTIANQIRLITKGEYKGKLAIYIHEYPLAGYTGAIDLWWIYDPIEKKRLELLSTVEDFEKWEEYEDFFKDEVGLI